MHSFGTYIYVLLSKNQPLQRLGCKDRFLSKTDWGENAKM